MPRGLAEAAFNVSKRGRRNGESFGRANQGNERRARIQDIPSEAGWVFRPDRLAVPISSAENDGETAPTFFADFGIHAPGSVRLLSQSSSPKRVKSHLEGYAGAYAHRLFAASSDSSRCS